MLEETLDIATKDGAMETFIVRPERNGPHPAVFLLMDAPGILLNILEEECLLIHLKNV